MGIRQALMDADPQHPRLSPLSRLLYEADHKPACPPWGNEPFGRLLP